MKKKLFFLFFIAFFSSLFAQTDIIEFVVPKKIFVGDTAELHYTFNSNVDFFPEQSADFEKDITSAFVNTGKDFTVKKIVIQRTGFQYTVIFTFVPWRTGKIDFLPLDLYYAVFQDSLSSFVINPSSFVVSSILAGESDLSLKKSKSPMLVPGTIYVVYALLVLSVVFAIFIVKILMNYEKIAVALKIKKALRKNKKNARLTKKALKKLEKKSDSFNDADFCCNIQNIARKYLTVRFDKNFYVLVSSEYIKAVETSMSGFLEGERLEKLYELAAVFTRSDYIRFAKGSVDSKRFPVEKFAAAFREGERKYMLETVRSLVDIFEKEEKIGA